jgi:hypothetical protein
MTIAISVKVHDGLVLTADSASTLIRSVSGTHEVLNVYNNANKIFNLCKGLPIGGMTWGSGSIGNASITTIAKDLRRRFAGNEPSFASWHLDPASFTVESVANRAAEFFEEKCKPLPKDQQPRFGFMVAGYSAGAPFSESWVIDVADGAKPVVTKVRTDDDCGANWYGEPEAVQRIVVGFGTQLPDALKAIGISDANMPDALKKIAATTQAPLIFSPMPIQDAIDLAEFLTHSAIMYSRFNIGAATVGGPIEIAAITKHEGFKWVKRKHYFESTVNPK